jgi:hypothetical protein
MERFEEAGRRNEARSQRISEGGNNGGAGVEVEASDGWVEGARQV